MQQVLFYYDCIRIAENVRYDIQLQSLPRDTTGHSNSINECITIIKSGLFYARFICSKLYIALQCIPNRTIWWIAF